MPHLLAVVHAVCEDRAADHNPIAAAAVLQGIAGGDPRRLDAVFELLPLLVTDPLTRCRLQHVIFFSMQAMSQQTRQL